MFSRPSPFHASNFDDDLLSAYLDGEVTAAERARVEQALASDPQARERLQTLEATVRLLRGAPRVAVPRVFTLTEAQVVAAGGRVKGRQQGGWLDRLFAGLPRLMPVATAAVALALLLVVGLDVWSSQFGATQPLAAPKSLGVNRAAEATAAPSAKILATEAPALAASAQDVSAEAPTTAPMATTTPPEVIAQVEASEAAAAPIAAEQEMSTEMSAMEALAATSVTTEPEMARAAATDKAPATAPTETPATLEVQPMMAAAPTTQALPTPAPAPLAAAGAGAAQEVSALSAEPTREAEPTATLIVQAAAQPQAEAAVEPAAPPVTRPATAAPSNLRSLELILAALLVALALLTLLTRRSRALR